MAGYVGSAPVPQSIQEKQSFTATAGQTTFNTSGYSSGSFVNVYLNGVRLINGTDYTATNGSDIVLTTAASASDVLDFEVFNEFSLVSQEFTNSISVEGDGTFDTAVVTVQNSTKENTEGGRESRLRFRGFKSGDVSPHTLAEIQGSHDGTSNDQKGDLIFKTNDGSDNAAPTEAFRVDSSQHLLVGKTSPSGSTAGAELRSGGTVIATVDGDYPLYLNRLTSDGDIAQFRKDGTKVGSIGIQSTGFYIDGEGGHAGLRFAGNEISPRDNGADADDTISLGESDKRFTNAYLSGGVFLGGVAAANRLDHYEEGLHSPTLTGSTSGSVGMRSGYQQLSYQVVGNRCTMTGRWEVSGGHSLSGNVRISLPFATANLTDQAGVGVGTIFLHRTGTDFDQGVHFGLVAFEGESQAYIYYQPSGTVNEALVQGSQLDSNFEGFINISFPIS